MLVLVVHRPCSLFWVPGISTVDYLAEVVHYLCLGAGVLAVYLCSAHQHHHMHDVALHKDLLAVTLGSSCRLESFKCLGQI